MCHIILLMPVFGLSVFWIWPIQIAAPVYTAILIISVVLYGILMRTMRMPKTNGVDGLRNELAKVVRNGKNNCLVRVHGELWKAVSEETVGAHEIVEITGNHGLVLTVRRPVNLRKHSKDLNKSVPNGLSNILRGESSEVLRHNPPTGY